MIGWTSGLGRFAGPRYQTIADALRADIVEGRLSPGSRPPTHRDLAYRLGVTVGTVTRAYAEAERRRLIAATVGRGTFVSGEQTERPDHGAGFPYPAVEPSGADTAPIDMSRNFPTGGYEETVLAALLAELASNANFAPLLGYQPHAGANAHRAAGARWIARTGLAAPPERVVVTGGGQNGISMALAGLAAPGDVVAAEALT